MIGDSPLHCGHNRTLAHDQDAHYPFLPHNRDQLVTFSYEAVDVAPANLYAEPFNLPFEQHRAFAIGRATDR